RATPRCRAASRAKEPRAQHRPRLARPNPTRPRQQKSDTPQEWPVPVPARPGTGASSPADSYSSHRRSRGSSPRHSRTLSVTSAPPRGGIQPVYLSLVVSGGCVVLILVVNRMLVVATIGRWCEATAGRHLARPLVVARRHRIGRRILLIAPPQIV